MAGQWVELPGGRWDWDKTAPAADPSPTHIQNAYAGRPAPMTRDDQATPRSVYDPRLGADGGGSWADDPASLPAIDPDHPVSHVDQLGADGPPSWTGSAPAERPMSLDEYERQVGPTDWPVPSDDLVACPTCGGGVHPDRIRGNTWRES